MPEERIKIPSEWEYAFDSAIAAYRDWPINGVLRQVTIDRKLYTVEWACGVITSKFDGTMSEPHHEILCNLASSIGDGSMAPEDRSYAAGARSLLRMIDYQKQLDNLKAKALKDQD